MDGKQLEIVRRIQAIQKSIEDKMDEALPIILKDFSQKATDLLMEVSLDPADKAKSLRETITIKRQLMDILVTTPAYQKEVKQVLSGFRELAKATDDYMSFILDAPYQREDLYKAILEANISVTKDALLGAGIRDNFANAIQDVLKANVSGESNRAQLNKAVRQAIEGDSQAKGPLHRYIKQTTNDAVQVFNAEYIQTISEDLNFEHYFYAGTLIQDSRQFCKARAGRYYTKKEVQDWAKLKWEGKMPGTNEKTIFIYRAGFNCRHTILPVSPEQYKRAQEEGTAGMK